MRWTVWVCAAAVIGWAGSALGYQPGCARCNGASIMTRPGLDAEPCAGPTGYCLAPGCCEDNRHCCDNAWAGYCDHRARVDAWWYRLGTGGTCGRGNLSRPAPMVPCSSCSSYPTGTMQPTPAVRPETRSTAPSPTPLPPQPAR